MKKSELRQVIREELQTILEDSTKDGNMTLKKRIMVISERWSDLPIEIQDKLNTFLADIIIELKKAHPEYKWLTTTGDVIRPSNPLWPK